MHSEGRTRAQIRRTVRCCDATVKRIIDLYRLHKDVEDRPRAPHKGPRKLRALQEELLIVAAIVDEPFLTLRELKKELNLSVTRNTVLRRLKQHGLICLNNSTCRNLTGWMKSARLSFARVHLAWTAAQWQKVVFTNESTICCKWDPNKNSWKGLHIWNDPVYIRQLKASGYTCINMLAVVTYDGLGPLIRSDESITPEQYVDIFNRTLMPYFLDGPFPDRGFFLQHDFSPTYTSDEVLECIKANRVHELRWPPKSEDLSPILSIWSCMKQRICRHRLAEPCPDKLWEVVKKHWDLLTKHKNIVAKLYSSIPNRLRDAVAREGGALVHGFTS
uniref:Putative transposable element n=1 Tax=Ixodes ricinus TaxID=34613 RepID=A0A131XTU4_IXORI